jgi:hypothetical protein
MSKRIKPCDLGPAGYGRLGLAHRSNLLTVECAVSSCQHRSMWANKCHYTILATEIFASSYLGLANPRFCKPPSCKNIFFKWRFRWPLRGRGAATAGGSPPASLCGA